MVIKNYMASKAKEKQKRWGRTDEEHETIVCMQLLKPESINHYKLALNLNERKNDQIVCIESMKLSLLAKSCLCPGLVVLITNLIKSSVDPPKSLENKEGQNWRWLYDYWNGKKYEIYRVQIPTSYMDI